MLNVLSKETTGKDTRLGDVHIPLREINFERPQKCWYELADLVCQVMSSYFIFTLWRWPLAKIVLMQK